MATVKFLLQQPYQKGTKKLNPKETRLYAFLIIQQGQMIKIKTEHTILPRHWDFKKQEKRDQLAGSPEFNEGLSKYKRELLKQYTEAQQQFPDMTIGQLRTILQDWGRDKERPIKKNAMDLFQVFDVFLRYQADELTEGTIKKFRTLKKSLQDFGEVNTKYSQLSFSMIDHRFKNDYVRYLRSREAKGRMKRRPKGQQTGLLLNTQGKYIESLKTFCEWAKKNGYNKYTTYTEFETIKPADRKKRKDSDQDIVTLTRHELRHFYDYDFSKRPSFERVRDLFCFGAFTGQRWSDIEGFHKRQLEGDVWKFTAQKTKKKMEIDLTGYAAPALDILKKYDYELPKITLQKFNETLKEAAREAGITDEIRITRYVGTEAIEIVRPKCEFLGSHTARKTCVSLLLNVYNLPITHVLEITGHSDLKTLQKYIDRDREARRAAMANTQPLTETMTVKHKAI